METLSDADRYYALDVIILGSCEQLRKVFKRHWRQKINEKWEDNDVQKEKLLSSLPSSKTNKCPLPFTQQEAIKEKSLKGWDMTLLAAIILLQCQYDDNICKAVKNLRTIRNSIAHVNTGMASAAHEEENGFRKCSAETFKKNVKNIKQSLLFLGMVESEIENLLRKPGEALSFKALQRVHILYIEAEELMRSEMFDQAIERYSNAIDTPNLLPEHLGEAYEKRAELYLSKLRNQLMDDDVKNQFQFDIYTALDLNSSSWKACYLAGQYHQIENKLRLAMSYYTTALTLSPGQKDVKQKLEFCKWTEAMQKRQDHFNQLPMNEDERVNDWIEKTEIDVSPEEYVESQGNSAAILIPGQDHVFKGHQYRFGWWVEKDAQQAAMHYAKSDEIGNPEGSYNLAMCLFDGAGVKQDIEKALVLYRRVANMNENTLGTFTNLGKNIGVAAARYTIGFLFQEGIHLQKDPVKAAYWYKKALDIGAGQAANNLGKLYWKGIGVPVDLKMAEMCWKQGINLRELNSAFNLVNYYQSELEPELASKMIKIGRDMGNYFLREKSDRQFEIQIEIVTAERDRWVSEVTSFEKMHKFDTKGLTFARRLARLQDFDSMYFDQFSKSILERKKYLQSPVRKEHIVSHRERVKSFRGAPLVLRMIYTESPKLKQTVPNGISKIAQIYLNEMNPTVNNIFEDKILYLTIIDDPVYVYHSIHLIAEDDNGDTTRLYIYNMGKEEETLDNFRTGCRISNKNPYMRIKSVETLSHGIQNDEPKCISYLEKVEQMCRFCGEGNSIHKCAKCKRPYCSRECQKLDWNMFQHKLICTKR